MNRIISFGIIFVIAVVTCLFYFEKLPYLTSQSRTKPQGKSIGTLKYRNLNFQKDKNDVFSFIHIQKTGGTTMEKHLVFNIKNSNCKCEDTKKPSCSCFRKHSKEIWLICRYIKPKWPCGLHPDYATLKECSPNFMNKNYLKRKRRYFYGTMLRDPVHRFLSEFRHMQRGANWEAASILCKGENLLETNPSCFEGKIWLDLTLNEFLKCPYNFAFNRQTWMLSNISKISCDFKQLMQNSEHSTKLLKIAKKNLEKLAYFGLLEYPSESQFIFEKTFGLEFNEPFQLWETGFVKAYLENSTLTNQDIAQIKRVNSLDIELYDHAKQIFFQKYYYFKEKYGAPKYKKPSKTGKFAMKRAKKRRLKENLPKSPKKEKTLKKKIKEERERQKRKKNSMVVEGDKDIDEEDFVDGVLEKKTHTDNKDEVDDNTFISKDFKNKLQLKGIST